MTLRIYFVFFPSARVWQAMLQATDYLLHETRKESLSLSPNRWVRAPTRIVAE